MRKFYLFTDLFDELFNIYPSGNLNLPKEDDSNFNKTVEEVETDTHTIKTEKWKSIDGKTSYTRTYMESKVKNIGKNIEQLKLEMKEAIEKENFEQAAKIRDEIKKVKSEE